MKRLIYAGRIIAGNEKEIRKFYRRYNKKVVSVQRETIGDIYKVWITV